MKVVMQITSAGPEGVFQAGAIRDLPLEKAAELCAGDYAAPLPTERLPSDWDERLSTIRARANADILAMQAKAMSR